MTPGIMSSFFMVTLGLRSEFRHSRSGTQLKQHHGAAVSIVVFVMSLFNLKMACADAIWCIFIEPKAARDDAMSLMHFVALNW
jgi:hypothetical protein